MTTILFDAEGRVVTDPALARTAEIIEQDALGRETRTYGTVGPVPAGDDLGDSDQLDDDVADQPKVTWDVYVQDDGQYRLVETFAEYASVLELDLLPLPAQRSMLANLMLLPVWDAMPPQLRDEITDFLEGTRPV